MKNDVSRQGDGDMVVITKKKGKKKERNLI